MGPPSYMRSVVDRNVVRCVPVYQYCNGTVNRLTPNDPYMGRSAPLTSKRCILYIYSTNIGTEYFKHALYSPLFSLQNAVCFIMLTCLVPVLFTFYIQDVLKLKKNNNNSGAKELSNVSTVVSRWIYNLTQNTYIVLAPSSLNTFSSVIWMKVLNAAECAQA